MESLNVQVREGFVLPARVKCQGGSTGAYPEMSFTLMEGDLAIFGLVYFTDGLHD